MVVCLTETFYCGLRRDDWGRSCARRRRKRSSPVGPDRRFATPACRKPSSFRRLRAHTRSVSRDEGAAGGEASALVWLAARMRALELGFSDEAAISVAEAIGAILDATSATVF